MSVAIVLLFDEDTDARMRAAWSALAEAGLGRSLERLGVVPHLTLFAADELRVPEDDLLRIAEESPTFFLGLAGIGLFPDTGVVYATVGPRSMLFDLHRRMDAVCVPHAVAPHDWYRPDGWMPHMTLAFGLAPEELAPAVEVLAPLGLKMSAEVVGLAIVHGDTDGWVGVREFPFGREGRVE